ncbi:MULTISPECIES: type VI secretion system lipoprotein TssJ [unclassified Motilimonas]|uniref:type VI secretion system lipoprotein TssJ n=1 Tax=unclassified Motilimonas TaxID=2643697 RepID=UPI001E582E94|nr:MULTISPECIES: type VI secretion system lipoprotein TssJ [unclassified Motilimonas]MCE0559221.1 type VI secretion system lipoprotein TssJ [Motilimonas sp. E26]MDO6527518.1 type VI secretion system lipoprotein TssJ [Motilimonas sp. 1_MG-2023]
MKWRTMLLLIVVFQITACSSIFDVVKKTGQVIWDPSIAIGDPEARATTVTLSLVADENINPNLSGIATPVAFQVFQLKDDSKYLAADYDALLEDPEKALGKNYLDHDDYALTPGQFKFIDAFEVDEDTKYVAVLAFYADPEKSEWKKIEKLSGRGSEFHFLVQLRELDVKLVRVD